MASTKPVVRQMAGISILPQIFVLLLLIGIFGVDAGLLIFLAAAFLLRQLVPHNHRKGIRYFKSGEYSSAIADSGQRDGKVRAANAGFCSGVRIEGRRLMTEDKINHYYEESGQGFPLILLHGNGEDCQYFVHQIPYFSEKFHVFALDTRGHGRTPRGAGDFTLERFVEDLKGFLDAHEIRQADFLGFSDGGNIALLFALKYPVYARNLVLNGANLHPGGVKWTVQAPIVLGYRIASLFARRSEGAKRNAEILGLMVNEPKLSIKDLEKIQARTLVIAGTRDMIRRSHTEEIGQGISGAKVVFLPGDHFIANKNPEAFNRVVMEFLETQEK